MCGDVGFSDKLFRCARCRSRFQHSYCTNYYGDAGPAEAGVCDWCLSDDVLLVGGNKKRQQYSLPPTTSRCSKLQQQAPSTGFGKGSAAGKVTGGVQEGGRRARRYKLLKDVLC
ncbi:hypothetical protein PR202_ga02206 [Eleusine coracana subsp. coracana]|uniref:PHD-type zinc finger plants domain-containing protein n=1 Tax=Eleusine coracana subsp. coracana TaxID=191504 RepID=A0AAV5BJ43_ELECO|nr:hypothetical protein PR202_ga02206 [Eleusine coracana subsp. coracana]